MKAVIYTACFLLLLINSGCATLLLRKKQVVQVQTDNDSAQLILFTHTDSQRIYSTPVSLEVTRSKQPLYLTLHTDSQAFTYRIRRRYSTLFWLGNLFSGTGCIGYGIDLTNPKRFKYPGYLTLKTGAAYKPGRRNYYPFHLPEQGQLNVHLSIPELNNFYAPKRNNPGFKTGFMGIGIGASYFYTDRHFFSVNGAYVTDFAFPVPVSYHPYGLRERVFLSTFSLQAGRDYGSVSLETGLQFQSGTSYSAYFSETAADSAFQRLRWKSVGPAFSGSYRVNEGFALCLRYQPSFISWSKGMVKLQYTQALMLNLQFSFNTNRLEKWLH